MKETVYLDKEDIILYLEALLNNVRASEESTFQLVEEIYSGYVIVEIQQELNQ